MAEAGERWRAVALRRPRTCLVAIFGVHAGVYGSFGPQVPAVKAQLGIDDGTLGLALAAMAVAMFTGTRVAGWATTRVDPRTVIGPAVPVLGLGLAGVGWSTALAGLVASLVVMGLGMGVLDVAMNAEAVDVEARWSHPVLGTLHGSWSAALLVAGAIAALINAAGITLAAHLTVMSLALVAVGVVAALALPSGSGRPSTAAELEPGAAPPLRYGRVAILGGVAAASFAAEGAATDWSAVYLHDAVGTSTTVAAAGFVAFALGMAASRFVADRVVTRVGAVPVVRVGGVVGALAMAVVLAVPVPAVVLAGLAVLGVTVAPVVPVIFRAAGAGPGGHRQLGWVVTVAYLGSVAGPATIGLVARVADLRGALIVVVALAAVLAAGAGQITDR